jgi:hypothetical protein
MFSLIDMSLPLDVPRQIVVKGPVRDPSYCRNVWSSQPSRKFPPTWLDGLAHIKILPHPPTAPHPFTGSQLHLDQEPLYDQPLHIPSPDHIPTSLPKLDLTHLCPYHPAILDDLYVDVEFPWRRRYGRGEVEG